MHLLDNWVMKFRATPRRALLQPCSEIRQQGLVHIQVVAAAHLTGLPDSQALTMMDCAPTGKGSQADTSDAFDKNTQLEFQENSVCGDFIMRSSQEIVSAKFPKYIWDACGWERLRSKG